jgi:acetate kinase
MRTHQIVKAVGAYAAILGGVDAIVFTAGVGENQGRLRWEVMKAFSFLGVVPDEKRNDTRRVEAEISAPESKVKCFIIPTNEELVIARDTKELVESL